MYGEHINALSAAAEFLAGNEWANLDTNQTNISSASQHMRSDTVRFAIITTECPAAIRVSGPPVEFEAGLGGKATYMAVIGRGYISGGDESDIWIDGTNGQTLYLENQVDADGTSTDDLEIDVVNFTEEVLAVGDEVVLVFVDGRYCVFPLGNGGGGESRATYTIVANSGITASTWPTAGTGTGDIYELSANGAGWSGIGGSPVDIRNPWEESIDSGSVMICYKEGDYYVVIQASCPSE